MRNFRVKKAVINGKEYVELTNYCGYLSNISNCMTKDTTLSLIAELKRVADELK